MTDVINALKAAQQNTDPPSGFDLDESIRRGRVRLRRRRIVQSGTGLAVTTAVVLVALLLPGTSGQDPPEPVDEPTFAVLDEPQQPTDEIPPLVRQQAADVEDPGLSVEDSSTRLVGEYEGLAYWLGTNADGHYCLVAARDGTWRGTGCSLGRLQMNHGSATAHPFPSATAHLFPDDTEFEIAEHAGLLFLSDNLAISTLPERMRDDLAGVLQDAAEYYSVFAEPQQPADRLPDLRNGQENTWFDESAARYLGEYRGERYWVGTRLSSESLYVSLVQVGAAGEWLGTSNLSGERGMLDEPWGFITETADVQMWLVPDGHELTDEQSSTWEQVAPNLYHDTAPEWG